MFNRIYDITVIMAYNGPYVIDYTGRVVLAIKRYLSLQKILFCSSTDIQYR